MTETHLLDVVNSGRRTKDGSGGTTSVWEDTSGAHLTAHITNGTIDCTHPSFSGNSRLVGRVIGQFGDDCPYCHWLTVEIVDEKGAPLYQQVVLLEDLTAPSGNLREGAWVVVRTTGLVEQLAVFKDLEDFRSQQPADSPFGPRWLVHMGTFPSKAAEPRKTSSHVMVFGAVKDVQELANTRTSETFSRVTVESYSYDMEMLIASEDTRDGILPGNFVRAICCVVGRVETSTSQKGPPASGGGGVAFGDAGKEFFDRMPGTVVNG